MRLSSREKCPNCNKQLEIRLKSYKPLIAYDYCSDCRLIIIDDKATGRPPRCLPASVSDDL